MHLKIRSRGALVAWLVALTTLTAAVASPSSPTTAPSSTANITPFVPTTAGSPAAADSARITNLAIRSRSGLGVETLIVGVTVGGAGTSGSMPLLFRGAGPTLAVFGVPGFLVDPVLSVFSDTTFTQNDNWGSDAGLTAVFSRVGAFPFTSGASLDAALYSPTVRPGGYTVQISGARGTTGVALAEVYDATPPGESTAATPRLTNVSARTQVGTGGDTLIAGFVISGSSNKTVLLRAAGPALVELGVSGVLLDPKLELYGSDGALVTSNDNWSGTAELTAAFTAVGAFSFETTSKDAALLVTLRPGAYTAQVTGIGGTSGIALVEVYEVP